jgi:NAD(P)-dependent dehydrogenase (short-subunit alcohol dehydrogenase family)
MDNFSGKRVLVTGAAGGIGLETARAFAREGARLMLLDIDGDSLVEARLEVKAVASLEHEPLALAVDLTDDEALEAAYAHLLECHGGVDVLVNNAGVCCGGLHENIRAGQLKQLLLVNLYAPLRLCQLVIPGMRERGSGHIVNLYSSSASLATPGFTAYAASKGGLATATRILRRELAGSGVELTLLCPGSVLTPMTENMVDAGKGPGALPQHDPQVPAAAIVEAVRKRRRFVMVSQSPLMQNLVVFLDRLWPSLLDRYWIKQADADYYAGAANAGNPGVR